jgi:hypothetical protein
VILFVENSIQWTKIAVAIPHGFESSDGSAQIRHPSQNQGRWVILEQLATPIFVVDSVVVVIAVFENPRFINSLLDNGSTAR